MWASEVVLGTRMTHGDVGPGEDGTCSTEHFNELSNARPGIASILKRHAACVRLYKSVMHASISRLSFLKFSSINPVFELVSTYQPAGDQPQAIQALLEGLEAESYTRHCLG